MIKQLQFKFTLPHIPIRNVETTAVLKLSIKHHFDPSNVNNSLIKMH